MGTMMQLPVTVIPRVTQVDVLLLDTEVGMLALWRVIIEHELVEPYHPRSCCLGSVLRSQISW